MASVTPGTKMLGTTEVKREPGPNTMRSAFLIASRAGSYGSMSPFDPCNSTDSSAVRE